MTHNAARQERERLAILLDETAHDFGPDDDCTDPDCRDCRLYNDYSRAAALLREPAGRGDLGDGHGTISGIMTEDCPACGYVRKRPAPTPSQADAAWDEAAIQLANTFLAVAGSGSPGVIRAIRAAVRAEIEAILGERGRE